MNETPAGTPAKKVYIEYTLDYQPGANATNSRAVDMYFQDVTGCGGSTYDIPGNGGPRQRAQRHPLVDGARDGIVVFSGGHLHDGGIDITLKNATSGAEYPRRCDLPREPASPGHDQRLPAAPPGDRRPPVLGHIALRQPQPYEDVMGIMLTYVWWGTQ